MRRNGGNQKIGTSGNEGTVSTKREQKQLDEKQLKLVKISREE